MKLYSLKHGAMKVWQVKSWAMRGGILILALMVPGCASEPKVITRTVRVDVPIITKATAPPELVARYRPDPMPIFVAPDDPNARASLTKEGIDALWVMIADLVARDAAWQAWATP